MTITTNYCGCTFRSLMEARWAVFFDYFGFTWNYEPHGLISGDDKYLPDFYLPEFDLYVEVKYKNDRDALQTTREFSIRHNIDIVVCDGNPHVRPLLLYAGSPNRNVLGFESKVLWFYKKGEGLAYEVTESSERPEYYEAVEKANTQRFGSLEIRNSLGQVRKSSEIKLKQKIKVLKEMYNISDNVIDDLMKSFREFNTISNQRAFNAAYRNRVDGLSLTQKTITDNFEYNKGIEYVHEDNNQKGKKARKV